MNQTLPQLLFGIRRSIRYHVRRRMFFDRVNLAASALSVIFGSAAMMAMLNNMGHGWVAAAALVVTIASAINLVVGAARMARLHADLARRFVALERDIATDGDGAQSKLPEYIGCRLEIEAEEPPVLRVLDSICHNELMRAMGYPDAKMLKIQRYQRFFAQFMDLNDHAITAVTPVNTEAAVE